MRRSGIMLIESMLVITIISIITSIILFNVLVIQRRGQEARLHEQLHGLRTAIAQFQNDVGGFPTTLAQVTLSRQDAQSELPAIDAAGNSLTPANYHGPYITAHQLPLDHFARDGQWAYDPTSGQVHSTTTRIALDGSAYANW